MTAGAAVVHDEEDEVGGFSADLEIRRCRLRARTSLACPTVR